MARPEGGYRTSDGKRVVGVTSVFPSAEGLIWWGWNIAHKPLMEARHLLETKNGDPEWAAHVANFLAIPVDCFDYKKVRQSAADAGTAAHERFEAFIHGKDFDPSKYSKEALAISEGPFKAAQAWAAQSQLKVTGMEVSLVSEKYRFGGTRDGVLIGGKRAIMDVKTSKGGVRPEMLCQLAAYGILDEEAGGVIDGGFHLLKFSKQEKPDDPVHFTHHHWDQLDTAKKAFLMYRELYDLMADLEKMAK